MRVSFNNAKLQKTCNSIKESVRKWGEANAKKIHQRLQELEAADNLSLISHLPPARLHELTQNRKGQLAVDVKQPFRIIFVPDHDPIPKKEDGGLDRTKVTAILILEMEDYHGE